MYSKEECKKHFESKILPKLNKNKIENSRRSAKAILNTFKTVLIFVVLFGSIFLMFYFPFGIIFLIVFSIIVYFSVYAFYNSKIKYVFKDNVISEIIKFYDQDAVYYPKKYIKQDIFDSTGLYNSYNEYTGEDYVEMKIYDKDKSNSTQLQFCELDVARITTDSNGNTSKRIVFKGLFYIVEFNKNFNCSLYLNGGRGKVMTLEDVEFNKMFKTRTSDQVEGRYILSTSLMLRLKKYKKSLGSATIKAAFLKNKMYVCVGTGKNNLEFNMKHNLNDFDNMYMYYQEIEQIISIVDALNLNNKIWNV